MSRKLVSIVEIASCDPIPETERLSVARMKGKGWQVVVGRGEFKPGDLCLYFEIDSFIPSTDERFAFLRERCLRKFVSKGGNVLREGLKIASVKLRGVVSQGLLMPLGKFAEVTDNIVNMDGVDRFCSPTNGGETATGEVVGADVTDLLHVENYDEVKERLQPAMGNPLSSDAMGPFPSLVPKTDEERVQNLGDWFTTMKGRIWQVTQKHDGTSCTIAYSPTVDPDDPGIVCSRNQRLKAFGANGSVPVHWQVAAKYKIIDRLRELYENSGGREEFAIQGEIVGPGINADRNRENEYVFYAFRMWLIQEQRFLGPDRLVKICREMGIPHVNVIKDEFKFFDEITNMEDALRFAEGKTPEGNEREGVVCKTVDDGPYASFKVVSNKYLLKGEK